LLIRFGPLVLAAVLLGLESFSVVGCSPISDNKKIDAPASNWLKVEAGAFSIYAPPGWKFRQRQGIDSFVGEFAGDGVVLDFDYGLYSNPLADDNEPTYVVTHETIGGYKARIVRPSVAGHGITGIYFPEIASGNKLCLHGQNLTDTQRELALRIFRTIRFSSAPPLR